MTDGLTLIKLLVAAKNWPLSATLRVNGVTVTKAMLSADRSEISLYTKEPLRRLLDRRRGDRK